MDKRNPLHVVLGIIGLAAWLLYVLACASWSPDSSKILFPYCDPETHQSGVALFDRNIGTVNSVFAQPIESCTIGDYAPMKARWSSDGSHAIVTWFEEKDKTKKNKKTKKKETVTTDWLHVEILPIGAKGRVRHFKLQDFTPSLMGWELPLVEATKNLYLVRGHEGSCVQLDLRNWHKKFRDLGDKREISF